jgi:hypothetical protein
MKYKITVEELIERPEQKYPSSEKVYEQIIDVQTGLVVKQVICAVNGLTDDIL